MGLVEDLKDPLFDIDRLTSMTPSEISQTFHDIIDQRDRVRGHAEACRKLIEDDKLSVLPPCSIRSIPCRFLLSYNRQPHAN